MLALRFFLGVFLSSPWSLSFPLHAPALILLSVAKVALSPTLTLSLLMILYSRQTALFLLARAAPAFLPIALSVALRPLFSFQQAQYVEVFPLKPAPFCTLFAGLGSTNKSAIYFLFYCLTLVLSSPPYHLLHLSSYLKLCGRSGRNCLLCPVQSGYNGSSDTRFSRGTTRLMSWPDGERYSRPPQSLVVSLLLSLVSTLLFSRTGGVLSHLNFLIQGSLNFHQDTCAPSSCSLCSLSSTLQRTQPTVRFLSLGLAESRILPAAPVDTCPRTTLITFCIVQLRTLCPSHSGDSLSLYDLWSRPWRVSLLLGLHGLPPCPHSSEGVG